MIIGDVAGSSMFRRGQRVRSTEGQENLCVCVCVCVCMCVCVCVYVYVSTIVVVYPQPVVMTTANWLQLEGFLQCLHTQYNCLHNTAPYQTYQNCCNQTIPHHLLTQGSIPHSSLCKGTTSLVTGLLSDLRSLQSVLYMNWLVSLEPCLVCIIFWFRFVLFVFLFQDMQPRPQATHRFYVAAVEKTAA